MAYKVIRQSNSNLALWDGIVQDLVMKDVDKEQILDYLLIYEKERIAKWINEQIQDIEDGNADFTFADALNTIIKNQTEAASTIIYYQTRNVI